VAPADFALKAWNFPLWNAAGTGTFSVVGSVGLAALHLSAGQQYNNIYVNVIATGGTATAGSNFAGLYNSAGTLVATTADISGALGTGAGNKGILAFPLTGTFTPAVSGQYYVGMFFNTSGTGSFPVLASLTGQTAATSQGLFVGSFIPVGISATSVASAAPYSFAAVATTSATAMPASFALGSAGTTGASAYWCGVS
jgi:hypothetical protein